VTEAAPETRRDSPRTDRRGFLATVAKGLGLVAVAEFLGVTGAYLWPRGREGGGGHGVVEAGPVGEFTPDSVTPFPGRGFYLVRLSDGGFLALSSTCSHLGCTVPWSEKDRSFPCPCHASVFDMRGDVRSPPAPRALDTFAISIEGGIVKVDTARPVRRARFEAGQVTYL
jgi:cytochrome b6-f complex iron-sulfur subunit